MNDKWDMRFLNLAKHIAQWSKDPSTQLGAVIVRPNKSVCSVGFNGFPQPMPDTQELYANREEKYSRVIHGEMNALLFAKEPVTGYTLYNYPLPPCDRCFVAMVQAGITRFVAPKPNEQQNERWGAAFEKTRQFARECGVELIEVEM